MAVDKEFETICLTKELINMMLLDTENKTDEARLMHMAKHYDTLIEYRLYRQARS